VVHERIEAALDIGRVVCTIMLTQSWAGRRGQIFVRQPAPFACWGLRGNPNVVEARAKQLDDPAKEEEQGAYSGEAMAIFQDPTSGKAKVSRRRGLSAKWLTEVRTFC
jgi:hypothetical protein